MSYDLVGPFSEYRVTVEGKRVPLLSAHPIDGGKLNLVFDGRFCVLLDVSTAESVVPFVADVIRGCLTFEHKWPVMLEIGEVND
jgi:hypothetical protein